MNEPENSPLSDTDVAHRIRIDEICDRFENQWKTLGSPPDLREFLRDDEAAKTLAGQDDLLVELLSIDRERRIQAGLDVSIHRYHEQFPESRSLIDQLFSGKAVSLRTYFDHASGTANRKKTVAVDDATIDSALSGERSVHTSGKLIRYFGDYEITSEIARGGMGVVYRARQISLNREIALKMILSGQIAGEDQIRRFQIEAEAAANLDHVGIVPIYDIGQHDGQHYFSMKLIEGSTLSDHSVKLRGDHARMVELVIAIADAMHHAHQRGILHRDLKPGNILIDADGRPWVTDFGLARIQKNDRELTHTGAVVGTPGFMSPEQASGTGVTTATDIYSLGAILYQLLCGRPPHQGDSVMQTLRAVIDFDPDPPRMHDPSIDSDLELICLKCLEKQPANRYTSAGELADELRAFLAGEQLRVRPPTARELARKWLSKRVGNAAWIPVIAIAIGLISGFAIWVGTVGEDLADYIPTYETLATEPMPLLAIKWPVLLAQVLILAFLFIVSTMGWWTAKLVQTKTRFADLGAGISVGLLSGLIATIAGVGTPFIYLATTSMSTDLDLLHTIVIGGQTDQGLLPIDQRYPDLEGLGSAQQAGLLVNKIKGDRIIATLTGPLMGTLFCLLMFGISGTFQTYVAGPLLRERSRFVAAMNYFAFAIALVAILFVFGSELAMHVLFGAGHWFDPTGPLLMGAFAILTITSIIRRWTWHISTVLSVLWIANFATIVFNPHIQGPIPQTPMKRKAISDAHRLVDINPNRRDYQFALARAEFDYGEMLRKHGMPKHSMPYYEASLDRLSSSAKLQAMKPDEAGLHSAALFWGSLAAMQAKDANSAVQWSSEHLTRYESSTHAAELFVRSVVASGQGVDGILARGDAQSPDIWWRIAQQIRSLAMQRRQSDSTNIQKWMSERVDHVLEATIKQDADGSWPARRDSLRQWLESEQSWTLFGPYDVVDNADKGFSTIHGPEQALILGETVDATSKSISVYPGSPLWLAEPVAARDNVVAFATSRLTLAEAGAVRFRIGSDDAIKIWIDGELMLSRNVSRALYPASEFVDVEGLNAGEHRILVKVYNWKSDWGFAIDGGATDGWPLPLWKDTEGSD